jgi:hypothetical protein
MKILLLSLLLPLTSHALNWGVNVHSASKLTTYAPMLKARGLNHARIDMNYTIATSPTQLAALRSALTVAKANGVSVVGIVFTRYQFSTACTESLATTEANAYNDAFALVNAVKDLMQDFEMMNEVDLRQVCSVKSGSGLGRTVQEYSNQNAYHHAANLKGISRAIAAVKLASGLPLRRIMGFTTMHIGFMDMLLARGVQWDVTGMHVYERAGYSPYNWAFDPTGTGWNHLSAAARYGKPIHLNETNAGEIYDVNYHNIEGDALTETGYKGFKSLLDIWANSNAEVLKRYGKNLQLETVDAYEIIDNPNNAGAEAKFGMLFSSGVPKVSMLLLSAVAGGQLSDLEKQKLISRGLMTAPPPPPPPPPPLIVSYDTLAVEQRNGTGVTLTPVITGGTGMRNCSATGLPEGISINATTCVISGTLSLIATPPLAGVRQEATVTVGANGQVFKFAFGIYPGCSCVLF